MNKEWKNVRTSDGEMRVYVARPEGEGPFASILVIQEIFGVTAHIQDIADRLAQAGFIAIAPEIYHRFDTSGLKPDDITGFVDIAKQLTAAQLMEDLDASIRYVDALSQASKGAVGIVGFCMGGRIAFITAARDPRIKAAVSFYGGGIVGDQPEAPILQAQNISAPVLLFFGAQDPMIPVSHAKEIDETLSRLGKEHEVIVYPEASHGFMRNMPAHSYHEPSAKDAFGRTLAFFSKHLGG